MILSVSLSNVYLFAHKYGDLSIDFFVQNPQIFRDYSFRYSVFPILFFLLVLTIVFFAIRLNLVRFLSAISLFVCTWSVAQGAYNSVRIYRGFQNTENLAEFYDEEGKIEPVYHLSKEKPNVIVLFLDRGIGSFVPHIFEELPEVKKQFDGFTYFPNCVSFSTATITGSPAMSGGYEYTQEKMNERTNELLRDTHNEALLAVPRTFANAGFSASLTNPPWPNYLLTGESLLTKNADIAQIWTQGKYAEKYKREIKFFEKKIKNLDERVRKEIRNFSILQSLPPFFRLSFNGLCRSRRAEGGTGAFINNISSLHYLGECVDFSAKSGTFTYICTDVAHDVSTFLSESCDVPAMSAPHLSEYCSKMDDFTKMHYQANVAAFKEFGRFFDFLKKSGVWDNSRIVIVSDHGFDLRIPEFQHFSKPREPGRYAALLLEKDFGENGELKTSHDFMTNADAVLFEISGLDVPAENPFTHVPWKAEKEGGVDVWECDDWNPNNIQNDKTFVLDKKRAYHISTDIFDEKKWIPLSEWR